jgi:DNA-binding response OmpR family regulator
MVASRDPQLAELRKHVLEAAGYRVIPVSDASEVGKTCRETTVNLVVIGYSVAPAQKRRIWDAARNECRVPILELYRSGQAELLPQHALFFHEAKAPEDFLTTVKRILPN